MYTHIKVIPLLLVSGFTLSQIAAADDRVVESNVVAIVDGVSIHDEELEARVADKLLRLKNEEYTVRRAVLEEYVNDILLAHEAVGRKTTVDDLIRIEVTDQIRPVTETEVRAVVESSANYQRLAPEEALRTAMDEILQRRIAKRRSEFLLSLRQRYAPTITLQIPRLTRPINGGHASGPTTAQVSIIEFSDFQCPYCKSLAASLHRLREQYPEEVRVVFKQFPLPSHPQATKAAEASLCAAEQGRFWEMHDTLFLESALLAGEKLDELAKISGLDLAVFRSCLASRKFVEQLARDKAEALALGVNATPTFFVNGLLVSGDKPFDVLRATVEYELQHSKQQPTVKEAK